MLGKLVAELLPQPLVDNEVVAPIQQGFELLYFRHHLHPHAVEVAARVVDALAELARVMSADVAARVVVIQVFLRSCITLRIAL